MKRFSYALFILFLAVAGSGCKKMIKTKFSDKEVYTKINLRYDADRRTGSYINYHDLTLLPANSKVRISNVSTADFMIQIPAGQTIKVYYEEKWGGKPMSRVLSDIFSETDISDRLAKFSGIDKKGIKEGSALLDMSKEAVMIAVGPPAAHKTSSFENDTWHYWMSRYTTYMVKFEDGKVVETAQ